MTEQHSHYRAESADVKHFISGTMQRNDHTLHALLQLDGQLNVDLLRQAVTLTFASMPQLTCRFVRTLERAYWEEAGWSAEDMICLINSHSLAADIEQQLVIKPDETQGPQMKLSVIRSDGKDTLAIVLNHMICDAGGLRDYLYLLAACYTALAAGDKGVAMAMPDPARRSFMQVFDHLPASQLEQVKLATVHHYPQEQADYLPLEGDPSQPFILRHRLSSRQFAVLRSYAKRIGATLNDALFAAYALAMADVLKRELIVLDCPVNARTYLPAGYVPGFCNLTTNLVCVFPASQVNGYQEALLTVKAQMDEQKRSFAPLKVYWDLENAYLQRPLGEAIAAFPHIYKIPINGMTNIGIIDEQRLHFAQIAPEHTSLSGSIKYAPYFQIAVTTFGGEMTFTTNFHGTPADRRLIDGLLDRLIAYLPSEAHF